MASSKVMASTSPANSDLPRQSSSIHSLTLSELHSDPTKNSGSMNMDDFFKSIYADPDAFPAVVDGGGRGGPGQVTGGLTSQGSFSLPKSVRDKTADEVWKEIMSGSGENMTLEDYLTKEGAISKEDVGLSEVVPAPGYAVESIIGVPQFQPPVINMQSAGSGPGGFGVDSVGFGNGIVAVGAPVAAGGSRRVKRRAVEEPPVDRATQQKQKRMIKNRESAARSRERKQAYTIELESLVTKLEEENARLMREEEELTRERYKQLMENLIPVVEKRRPPRFLRRMNSL